MTSDFQNATPQKRYRPESPVASGQFGKLRKKDIEVEVERKSDNCEFTAKDISEDKLIVEMFVARSVAKMHTGEKSNQCDQCVYTTNDSNYMKRHLKRHDREKINKCQHCDFTSCWEKNLRTHLKTHSVEKAHKCNQCY